MTGGLSARIRAAKAEAFKEAKAYGLPWVFSRGAYVATVGADGCQCDPWPGADPMAWDGKVSSLAALIVEASAHPGVSEIVLGGGYDGADTMADKQGGNYEPWIASWSVTLWTRSPEAR